MISRAPSSSSRPKLGASQSGPRARWPGEFGTALSQACSQSAHLVHKKRLAECERSLQTKETTKARDDVRIATNKIETYLDRLADARRSGPKERDSRIFPMVYAPVVANIDGRLQIAPMRYTCRLAGKPANYDVRYPGTYNAFGAFLTVSS
jgi:hypothetical protein